MRRTLSGARRAAIGSTLLRSPGSNNPLPYDFNGSIRSACLRLPPGHQDMPQDVSAVGLAQMMYPRK